MNKNAERKCARASLQPLSANAPVFIPRQTQSIPSFFSAATILPLQLDAEFYLQIVLDLTSGMRYRHSPSWLRNVKQNENENPGKVDKFGRLKKQDVTLDSEIEHFCDFFSPTPEERRMRNEVSQNVIDIINELWPEATVELYGSCATDLYLPTSDIDLAVFTDVNTTQTELFLLAKALNLHKIPRKLTCLPNARIPLIKLIDASSSCKVDISFNTPNVQENTAIICRFLEEFPQIRKLALVLKSYLRQLRLDEPFTGGLASFTLLLLIVSFMQRRKPVAGEDKDLGPSTGTLLLQFLRHYGYEFKYEEYGISTRDGGYLYSKKARGWDDHMQPHLLSVEDPSEVNNDSGKKTFRIQLIKAAFRVAYDLLSLPNLPTNMAIKEWKGDRGQLEIFLNSPSLLARIILKEGSAEWQRKMVQREYSAERKRPKRKIEDLTSLAMREDVGIDIVNSAERPALLNPSAFPKLGRKGNSRNKEKYAFKDWANTKNTRTCWNTAWIKNESS